MMNKKSFYDNFLGKSVVVKTSDERIQGKLYSIDGYLNVAIETDTDTIYVKGSAIDYVSLDGDAPASS